MVTNAGTRWGKELRRWREGRGHSQALVGKRLGMSPPQLSRMEAGLGHNSGLSDRGPVLAMLMRMCDALGVVIVLAPGGRIRITGDQGEA